MLGGCKIYYTQYTSHRSAGCLRCHYRDFEGDPSSDIEAGADFSQYLLICWHQQHAESSESPPLLQRPHINEKEDNTFQAVAVILIALVAMGEDISVEMSLRQFNHLVRPSIQLSPIRVLTNSADALWRLWLERLYPSCLVFSVLRILSLASL